MIILNLMQKNNFTGNASTCCHSRRRGSRQPDPNEKPELRYRTLFRRLIRLIQINQDQIKTPRKQKKQTKDLETSPEVRVVVETLFFGFGLYNHD